MRSDEGSTAVADNEDTAEQQEQQQPPTVEDQLAELARMREQKERENECVTKIYKTRMDITEQEATIEEAKGTLKKLNGQLDKLNHELCEIVRGQADTLFDGVTPKPEGAGAADPTPEEDDSWRRVPLTNIGFKPKHVEALATKELTTLGELADWMSAGQNRLTDIDGVGPKAQEEMEDVLATYWANNPRKAKENPANEAIVTPFDIGLNREDIVANVWEELLENAVNGNGEQKVPALTATAAGVERLYVNVGNLDPITGEINVDGDKPTNRLIPLLTPEEFKAAFPADEPTGDGSPDDDKLVGIKVRAGRKSYFVGKRSESILVSVGE